MVNYIHDELDSSNGILYLLEKYKRRTEWFLAAKLENKYKTAAPSYEQVFEDDLRMYLFDQGIDYPFSTPASSSGRADIIGLIETNDPLILEIKIFDKQRSYGKPRISSGFAQIVRYARDYNKPVGYLVIYNLDKVEIHIETERKDKTFPYRIEFAGKIFYIIIVNLNFGTSSSKLKKLDVVSLTMDEIITEVDN